MRVLLAFGLLTALASPAYAAVSFGGDVTVPNDPATGAAGATVTLTNVSVDDALAFSVSGMPYLQIGNTYGVNAAGVVTTAGTTGVGGSSADPSSGFTYGALIATFTTGTFTRTVQVFATSLANGANSATPPTSLSYAGSLGQLFAYDRRATTVSGTLNFRVDDSDYADNSGSFRISQASAAVPEPASWAMMIAGFGLAGTALRRRRVTAAVRFS